MARKVPLSALGEPAIFTSRSKYWKLVFGNCRTGSASRNPGHASNREDQGCRRAGEGLVPHSAAVNAKAGINRLPPMPYRQKGREMSNRLSVTPNDLRAFWMPFTANRQFKKAPRMFVSAKDMHYTTSDGRQVLDGTAGLWCVNAGHCRPKITEAIQEQAAELDYAPAFQMGHPKAFELANRLVDMAPEGIDHVLLHQLRFRIGRHGAEDGASPITARAARARASA